MTVMLFSQVPRVELLDVGPSMQLNVRRAQIGPEATRKEAIKGLSFGTSLSLAADERAPQCRTRFAA